MQIIVTRHGETDWNRENRILGSTERPLNATGLAQAEELAARLQDVPFTRIITSPQLRAKTTAEIVAAHHHKPVLLEPRLAEQNFGIYEGKLRTDAGFQRDKRQFFQPLQGGESILDVTMRVFSWLEEIKQQEGTPLVVCHGGVLRVIHAYFNKPDNEKLFSFFAENCGLYPYEF